MCFSWYDEEATLFWGCRDALEGPMILSMFAGDAPQLCQNQYLWRLDLTHLLQMYCDYVFVDDAWNQ